METNDLMSYLSRDLRLHEEVLLLALRDKKGTIESRAGMYRFALGGAILAELLIEGRIAVESGKKKLVEVTDPGPLHDPLMAPRDLTHQFRPRSKPT